jgi:hypothetical protein
MGRDDAGGDRGVGQRDGLREAGHRLKSLLYIPERPRMTLVSPADRGLLDRAPVVRAQAVPACGWVDGLWPGFPDGLSMGIDGGRLRHGYAPDIYGPGF